MGVVENVGFDKFPKQGDYLHRRFRICFYRDTDRTIGATCIRDDVEGPGVTLFRLDDGRVILAKECQYQPAE